MESKIKSGENRRLLKLTGAHLHRRVKGAELIRLVPLRVIIGATSAGDAAVNGLLRVEVMG